MVNIYSTLSLNFSVRVISQRDIWTIKIIKRGEGLPCWNHVPWSSRINYKRRRSSSACKQGMNSLLFFRTWSSFLLLCTFKKRDLVLLQELSQDIDLFLHVRAIRMKSLTIVCTLARFTFTFLLWYFFFLEFQDSSWDLELSPFWSGGLLSFLFPLESIFESPATNALYLEGLMVPIITNLSYSFKDSMKYASEGIFRTWSSFLLLVVWRLLMRLGIVSLLIGRLIILLIFFGIHIWISSNQWLIFGRFDGAHHYQFMFLLGEGFHELRKLRKLLGSWFQLGGMEGRKNQWVVKTKIREYGQD